MELIHLEDLKINHYQIQNCYSYEDFKYKKMYSWSLKNKKATVYSNKKLKVSISEYKLNHKIAQNMSKNKIWDSGRPNSLWSIMTIKT